MYTLKISSALRTDKQLVDGLFIFKIKKYIFVGYNNLQRGKHFILNTKDVYITSVIQSATKLLSSLSTTQKNL